MSTQTVKLSHDNDLQICALTPGQSEYPRAPIWVTDSICGRTDIILTPDEAEALARALVEAAAEARKLAAG